MMDKKGELTSKQIVLIIILIVSFAAILIFFFSLNLKSEINTETCRNSVVLRGLPGGDAVSLNCKTQDVCFSVDGESCESVGKDVINVEVRDKEKLLEELADFSYQCYWQMGSGEIDYAPSNLGFRGNYCAICNNFYFSEELKENDWLNSISQKEYYEKLANTKTPGRENNLLFEMYGLTRVTSEIFEDKSLGEELLGKNFAFDYENGWVLVTGLNKGGLGGTFLGATGGVVLGVVAIVTAPITAGGSLVAASAVVGGLTGGGIGFYTSGASDFNNLPPTPYLNDPKTIRDIGCYEFESLP